MIAAYFKCEKLLLFDALGQLIVSKCGDIQLDPAKYGLFVVENHKSEYRHNIV